MTCQRCDHATEIKARGLCDSCYHRVRANGTVDNYPTVGRAVVAAERFIDAIGSFPRSKLDTTAGRHEIADALGITPRSMNRRIVKARKLGLL